LVRRCLPSQALSRNQAVHANSSDSKIKTLDRFNIDVATQNGLLPDLNIIAPLVNDVEPRTGSRLNDYNSFLNGRNGPNKHPVVVPVLPILPQRLHRWPAWRRFDLHLAVVHDRCQPDAQPHLSVAGVSSTNIEGEVYDKIDYCWYQLGYGSCARQRSLGQRLLQGRQREWHADLSGPARADRRQHAGPAAEHPPQAHPRRHAGFRIPVCVEQANQASFAQQQAASFITTAYSFSSDPQALLAARDALGNQLQQLAPSPTIALAALPMPSAPGRSVTFTATLTASAGTPTGLVIFYEGATELGRGQVSGGTASFSTTALAVGDHSITAFYKRRRQFRVQHLGGAHADRSTELPHRVSASPAQGGSVSGAGTFAVGTSRTVTAMASSGYVFSNWTENGSVVSTLSSYTFTLSGNRNLVANFTQVFTIAVGVSPTGAGTVGGGGTFAAGSTQTVTATANTGFMFTNWTEGGNVVSTSPSYAFPLTAKPHPGRQFCPDLHGRRQRLSGQHRAASAAAAPL